MPKLSLLQRNSTIDCEPVEKIREDGSAGFEQSDINEDPVNPDSEVFDIKLLEGRFLYFSIKNCLDWIVWGEKKMKIFVQICLKYFCQT